MSVIKTPITDMFGIQHPIMLAGMNVAAGPELAAAVSNAGGLGVIGGLGYTPKQLRNIIKEIKSSLKSPDLPFGVDLLIPSLGPNARKTNYDYTKGHLDELLTVIIEEKAKLFVCAVGVPPKEAVKRLHDHGIICMNMVGHPKHVQKALDVGMDLICAQGAEGGGHTGRTPYSVLIPACVDICKGKKSPLTGGPVHVIAAGGIYDGRGLASALMYGAQGVWVGTRFVASTEAGAPKKHKDLLVSADHGDTDTTLIYTGRPLRVRQTDYVKSWRGREEEIKNLTSQGKIPHEVELEKHPEKSMEGRMWLMGEVSALINDIKPAKEIIDEMVKDAKTCIENGGTLLAGKSRAKL
ncbi:putative 2-nitropropane dioxygenase [Kockovaella imperatae]|uniref:Putative 2-nitropropane dioxygenase n=1 Tax=Kockovaella imperatae TaxID=4999 RepID=A0A1Y1UEG5_9TREE|nr:putative 2-nitropropane dioxygenase [Kockovaella imperatae]ORX36379.1 putative 2-nitropropane dioxygenase [Kockovaella imperatae]